MDEVDSDLTWMIWKGSWSERHYQELIPDYHIDSPWTWTCSDLNDDNYNWEISGQEGTCDFTFQLATVTKFDLYTAKCEESTVPDECTKQN